MEGLTVGHITSGYGNNTSVVHDVSLAVKQNETLMLMGPSGSGKSTLILTILGIIKPTTGSIFVGDKEITHLPIEERSIGYMPQDYGLFPHLNVWGNVGYGLTVRGFPKEHIEKTVKEMLALVELTDVSQKHVHQLSGGQRQRVGLARALAIKPNLLLLDEPLSSIDQVTKADVAHELKGLFDKLEIPIIIVTHNHEDAYLLSENLAVMVDGKIEQVGMYKDILQHPKTEFIQKLLKPIVMS